MFYNQYCKKIISYWIHYLGIIKIHNFLHLSVLILSRRKHASRGRLHCNIQHNVAVLSTYFKLCKIYTFFAYSFNRCIFHSCLQWHWLVGTWLCTSQRTMLERRIRMKWSMLTSDLMIQCDLDLYIRSLNLLLWIQSLSYQIRPVALNM